MPNYESYALDLSPEFQKILKSLKRKKPEVLRELENGIEKVLRNPAVGKPLRNVLRNYRRIHLDPFVLVYEIHGRDVRLLDFDHHDRIYKKWG